MCGKILAIIEKPEISGQDLYEAVGMFSCEDDNQQTMDNGQPNIVATRTRD
jgi:hypothetical protein